MRNRLYNIKEINFSYLSFLFKSVSQRFRSNQFEIFMKNQRVQGIVCKYIPNNVKLLIK